MPLTRAFAILALTLPSVAAAVQAPPLRVDVRMLKDLYVSPSVVRGTLISAKDNEVERGFPWAALHLSRHDTKSSCGDYYSVYALPLGLLGDVAGFGAMAFIVFRVRDFRGNRK